MVFMFLYHKADIDLLKLKCKFQLSLGHSKLNKKTKFSIKDFFSKCDQIRRLKKSLMENFIFCAVYATLVDIVMLLRTFLEKL